jgi:hypothetical protein
LLLISALAAMSYPMVRLPGASTPTPTISEHQYEVALPRGVDLSIRSSSPVSSPEVVSNTPTFPIEKLPVELRLMIFEPVCIFDGKMPALIIVLRPLEALYHEALQLFYKNSNFVLQETNNFSLRGFGDRRELR